jgi:hypothetical protein
MGVFDFFRSVRQDDATIVQLPTPGQVKPSDELGVSGVRVASGYVYEEFLTELQGIRGRRIFREMCDNDDVIGAVLTAIESMLRAADWNVEPSKSGSASEAKKGAQFFEECLADMDHTFEDFICEVLTYLTFGFAYFETVYKRRDGLYCPNLENVSRFSDGKIGIRKLAPRAQETLIRWEMSDAGDVLGFWQLPPQGGVTRFIPIDKALLFRTKSRKNNPEGYSLLRNAYVSYYYKKNLQIVESIAIERELAGMPIITLPSEIMNSQDPQQQAVYAAYQKVARDMKFNEQAALIIPSNTYMDGMGKPTNIPMVDIKLISAQGSRHIDTNVIINRYSSAIARTVLADFLILGSNSRGSFALSKSKTDLFLRSIEGYLNNIAAVINRGLIPTLWRLNGFSPETMPKLKPGQIAPPDLTQLGLFVQQLASAGIIFGDNTEAIDYLLDAADIPTGENMSPYQVTPDSVGDDGPVTL